MNKKLLIPLVIFLISFNVLADTSYIDVPKNDSTKWYYDNLMYLSNLKIVEGNESGYFMPDEEVTYNQYLKMIVVALDKKTYTAPQGEKWDKPYNDRAIDLGLIDRNEITNYNGKINRYDMAKVIVKACNESYADYNKYKSSISDFNTIPTSYEEYVLKAFSKGLITGRDSKGRFDGRANMKRSESVTVIARLLNPSLRKLPGEIDPKEGEKPKEDPPTSSAGVYHGVTFDPAIDVIGESPYTHVMSKEKSIEFIHKVRDTLAFTKENGKYYISGDILTMPEGYEVGFSFDLMQKDGLPTCYDTHYQDTDDRKLGLGKFKREIRELKSPADIKNYTITISICLNEDKAEIHPGLKRIQLTSCAYYFTYIPGYPQYTEARITDKRTNKSEYFPFTSLPEGLQFFPVQK